MDKCKKIYFLLLVFCMLGLTACGRRNEIDENKLFQIYCISNSETKVISREYEIQSETVEAQIQELLEQLTLPSERLEYKSPLSVGFNVDGYKLQKDKLTIDVDGGYRKLSPTMEVLVRAALVRTLTQVEGVAYMSMTVNGEPLTDNLGNPVGVMAEDMFIDNAGNEINAYEKVTLKLYFANQAGDGLVSTNRYRVYSSNISLEKLVVEELIKGPNGEGLYPTINKDTKIVSVSIKDGICYVNLDKQFLTQTYNVSTDVTIYSITNSLVELPNVNKVQISVNGETDLMYRETISLTTVFERNLDLVKTEE